MKKLIPEEINQKLKWKTTQHGENLQFPFVEKVIPQEEVCEDCGEIVVGRRISIKRNKRPYAHWKISCNSCGLCRNPETGEFNLNQHEYTSFQLGINKNDK